MSRRQIREHIFRLLYNLDFYLDQDGTKEDQVALYFEALTPEESQAISLRTWREAAPAREEDPADDGCPAEELPEDGSSPQDGTDADRAEEARAAADQADAGQAHAGAGSADSARTEGPGRGSTQEKWYRIRFGCGGEEEIPAYASEADRSYIAGKVKAVAAMLPAIDEKIGAASKGWKVSRMPKADLAVLRLAVYETEYDESIPPKVAVNEAVELAKAYGNDDKSPSFVNGVLSRLLRQEGEEPEGPEEAKAGIPADAEPEAGTGTGAGRGAAAKTPAKSPVKAAGTKAAGAAPKTGTASRKKAAAGSRAAAGGRRAGKAKTKRQAAADITGGGR